MVSYEIYYGKPSKKKKKNYGVTLKAMYVITITT